MYLQHSYLLAQGDEGNEAFLGIGVLGWVIIVAVVLIVAYLLYRGRGRRRP